MNRNELGNQIIQLQNPLLAFAMKLSKDSVDAMDLYQDTALRALDNNDSFTDRGKGSLKNWLMTIMRNLFINKYRKRKRKYDIEQKLSVSSSQGIVNEAEGKILEEEILGLIKKLDEDKRVPFLLSYDGHSYAEISEALGIPMGTVKSKIFYARKSIKKLIQSGYGGRPDIRQYV